MVGTYPFLNYDPKLFRIGEKFLQLGVAGDQREIVIDLVPFTAAGVEIHDPVADLRSDG